MNMLTFYREPKVFIKLLHARMLFILLIADINPYTVVVFSAIMVGIKMKNDIQIYPSPKSNFQ